MKKPLLYLDTSVFGGVFDSEFQEDSRRVIAYINSGKATLIISDTTLVEINRAPERVQKLLLDIHGDNIIMAAYLSEAEALSKCYLADGVVAPKWKEDTLHVALATVNRADAIISWNFKHIVRLDKIKAYNLVNTKNGYGVVTILSPKEVIIDEEE